MPNTSEKKNITNYLDRVSFELAANYESMIKIYEPIPARLDQNGSYRKAADHIKRLSEVSNVYKRVGNRVKKMKYLPFVNRKYKVPKFCSKEEKFERLMALDDKCFVEEMRMSKISFHKLCDMLRGLRVYASSRKNPQTPVEIQVSIVLERLGSYGSGVSVGKLARRSGAGSK